MLSISRSQARVLAESVVDGYLDRVTTLLQTDFPAELGVLPFDELRHHVRLALERFRAHEYQRKEHLYRLIVLELLFGPKFELKLPREVQLFAFPAPGRSHTGEAERFWAVYRAAEHLERTDDPAFSARLPHVSER